MKPSSSYGAVVFFASFVGSSQTSAQIDTLVVPPGYEDAPGRNCVACNEAPSEGVRFQELYLANEFPSLPDNRGVLIGLAWRPIRTVRRTKKTYNPDFELRLSTTDAEPGRLSNRFGDNIGDDETLVFSGDLRTETDGSGPSGGPRAFDYTIDFQEPFIYDSSQGNLLLEWRVGPGAWGSPSFDAGRFSPGSNRQLWALGPTASTAWGQNEHAPIVQFTFLPATSLQAGDADQDLDFDQFDLVHVQQAAKYLTGEPATWGEGDWNGAPGGFPLNPPQGDGVFDQFDIIAAQQAGIYLTSSYASVQAGGTFDDGQVTVGHDARTGEVRVDASTEENLTSINIDSATGTFIDNPAQNLSGSFDDDTNVFKATYGGSLGSLSFGNVAHAGLEEKSLLGDLTVVGTLARDADLGDTVFVYVPVPEPASILLLGLGVLALASTCRRASGKRPF